VAGAGHLDLKRILMGESPPRQSEPARANLLLFTVSAVLSFICVIRNTGASSGFWTQHSAHPSYVGCDDRIFACLFVRVAEPSIGLLYPAALC